MITKLNGSGSVALAQSRPGPVHLLRRVAELSADVVVPCGRLGNVTLRVPKKSDYDAVFHFHESLYKSGVTFWGNTTRFHTEDWVDWAVKATNNATAAISVADLSGRIVGIATISPDHTEDGGATLFLGVDPWAENNRVGTNLTGNVLEKAVLIGFPRVRLYVGRKNLFAQQIYRKHGFIGCGGGAKNIRMVREL